MPSVSGWLLMALAALLSAGLAWPLRHWLLRQRLLDRPEARRSHAAPTPRGGGLAIVAGLTLAWLAWPGLWPAGWPVVFLVLAMAAVGWREDRRELSPARRLLLQAVATAALLLLVGGIDSVAVFGHPVSAVWLWSLLGGIAVVWLINLYNFMDGSDGLAAGQGVWAGLVSAGLFHAAGEHGLALLAMAGAGAWAGFLVWNRPPARIFMGDSGSLALGGLVGAMAVFGAATGAISIWSSFMISSLFVVDATATLVARVGRGERWYTAHRQHAYQRLLDLGFSHGRVMGGYMLVNVLVVLPLVAVASGRPGLDTALAVGLAATLLGAWWAVQRTAKTNNDKA